MQLPSWIPPWLRKPVAASVLIFAVGFAVYHSPLREPLVSLFEKLGEGWKAFVLLCLIAGLVYLVVQELDDKKRLSDLEEAKKRVEEDRNQLQQTMDRLNEEANKNIWQRPDLGKVPFRPKGERRARLVSFLNLKGGPGKTTLAANIAACMVSLPAPKDLKAFHPKKILVIDLDFQGTLSNISVANDVRERQRELGDTSARLLEAAHAQSFNHLSVDMNGFKDVVKVIVADEKLEQADFTGQAKFFLDSADDVRFRYRNLLHHGPVADDYDLVIFDCPPRFTTSSVNALACSDYVVIPTKLDEKSIEAVIKTLVLLDRLSPIAQPAILGIVANEVVYYRAPKLIQAHNNGLRDLTERVREYDRKYDRHTNIFTAKVKQDMRIAQPQQGAGRVPAADQKVKAQFIGISQEIRGRIT